jgi:ABC-type transport system involved in multi-copper enzyme maturation permease subunit
VTALRNVAAIVQKEWHHYFGSPIAWVALFVWTMLFGIFFYFGLTFFLEMSMRASQQAMQYGGPTRHPEHGGRRAVHRSHAHHAALR